MAEKQSKSTKESSTKFDKLVTTFLLTALVVFPLGFVVGNSAGTNDVYSATSTEDTHTHLDDSLETDKSHSHEPQEVADVNNAPEISNLQVVKDPMSGWNVSFETTNFAFTPENASSSHVEGEGHAHIYVDGKKITRLYSNSYYLAELSEGSHEIKVSLNTNDHKEYTANGEVVEVSKLIADMHHSETSETESDMNHSH